MAADPTYPLFPIVSFVGFILVLIPLPWHFQSWNSGTCYYMIWTALACLNQFINSVVWSNNALNIAPAWCEISTRITIGASVGIPAASLCINRRLYKIARAHTVASTAGEKRLAVFIDSLTCVLFPIICMVFAYIVQGHRFNIFEVLGCYPAIYNTLPAYFLVYMWPVVIGLISAVYCTLSLRLLFVRQAQFKEFLSKGSSLTRSRYFRLMALAMTEMAFTIPLGIYELYSNAAGGDLQPWQGWANAHYDFSRVVQYPYVVWTLDPKLLIPLQLSRWIIPTCALVFFSFFGFAEEARKRYRQLYHALGQQLSWCRVSPPSHMCNKFPRTAKSSSKDSLPMYTTQLSRSWTSRLLTCFRGPHIETKLNEKRGFPMTSASTLPVFVPCSPLSVVDISPAAFSDTSSEKCQSPTSPIVNVDTPDYDRCRFSSGVSEFPDTPSSSSSHTCIVYSGHAV